MRPLVLVDKYPLPAIGGSRQRLWHLLRGLSPLGPGEVIVLDQEDSTAVALLEGALPGWSVRCVPMSKRPRHLPSRLRWLVRRDLPTALATLDLDPVVRAVSSDASGDGRLIVALRPTPSYVAVRARMPGDRVVCDLEDIEHVKLTRLVDEEGAVRQGLWPRLRTRMDITRWQGLATHLVRSADLVTVCSDADRTALGSADTVCVVPNGAEIEPLSTREPRPDGDDLLYLGQMSYAPNARAAERMARSILPLVRRQRADARLRIVGPGCERLQSLADLPGVEVVGFVEDLAPEWERAAALVVPLSSGSGTRLKILEAFARQVPVISTSIGAEGIEASDQVHMLLADEDEDFAAATVTALDDLQSAHRRAAAAHTLVRDRYDWTAIEADWLRAVRGLG